mmetsp:Transcript_22584/g.62797  ORF Transcript_22584/g.62797 Transcript_22584/m.62797 type:complete len:354 (+) Transcript_22584:73-1134(+)
MRVSLAVRSVLSSSLLLASGARAFSPRSAANKKAASRFLSSASTQLRANVLKLSNPQTELLDQVDIFIFDCDGVIWRGDSLIDGIPQTLQKLRDAGKRCFFVTNNSTKSRAGYKKKFDSLGLDSVPAEEIFSSSFAAAAYLEQTNFKETNKKVYVIGEVGICQELDLIGVEYIGGPDDAGKQPEMGPCGRLEIDEDVGAVIVGFDRHVNYYKIQYARLAINENNAQFIATNLDAVTHLTDAQEWAGNGSMVGAIKGCTGQEPTVVGKPSPLMIDYLESKYGMDRSRICMVGDRLDTDILFGSDNGLKSLLVLSGVTSEEKLLNPDNTITPDFYAETINDFFAARATSSSGTSS